MFETCHMTKDIKPNPSVEKDYCKPMVEIIIDSTQIVQG